MSEEICKNCGHHSIKHSYGDGKNNGKCSAKSWCKCKKFVNELKSEQGGKRENDI